MLTYFLGYMWHSVAPILSELVTHREVMPLLWSAQRAKIEQLAVYFLTLIILIVILKIQSRKALEYSAIAESYMPVNQRRNR